MPRQNRVDPFGRILTVPQLGTLMGNRGNLHTATGEIVRPFKRKEWVTCLLEYRGRHREILAPDRYTELFFLDEATSLAAGHRPCGTCRREALKTFRGCWANADIDTAGDAGNLKRIDAILHSQRIDRKFELVDPSDLPDGAFVSDSADGEDVYLWWRGKLRKWSFDGYANASGVDSGSQYHLVTPACIVDVLKAGYPVAVHESADA